MKKIEAGESGLVTPPANQTKRKHKNNQMIYTISGTYDIT